MTREQSVLGKALLALAPFAADEYEPFHDTKRRKAEIVAAQEAVIAIKQMLGIRSV